MKIEKSLYEQMGGTYTVVNGYLIPDLVLSAEEEKPAVGIWGQSHLRYIKQYKKVFYINLLTRGRLHSYLADIDEQARDMFSWLVKQMAEKQGATEQLKANNQMEWVQRMNNVRHRTGEIVLAELIYQ